MDWFRPSAVILALLFRKNTTKHTIIATVTTEVSNEINAITMAAIATSFRYLLEAGTTTGKRE